MMEKLEQRITILICKLEKIFYFVFFNLMQHLLIYLPYEAKVGGPIQYIWMYHIERTLKKLHAMVGNKRRVEVCIVEEFKYKETASFTVMYVVEERNVSVPTLWYHVNIDPPCSDLEFFQWRGKTIGACITYCFIDDNWKTVLPYMYNNMEDMNQYLM
jgi:hypothetical protein